MDGAGTFAMTMGCVVCAILKVPSILDKSSSAVNNAIKGDYISAALDVAVVGLNVGYVYVVNEVNKENTAAKESKVENQTNNNGKDLPSKSSPTVKVNEVDINQKPMVSNTKLKNYVNDLYKGQGGPNTIGNGTTMDAVRNEMKTGMPTNGKFHTQKLSDILNGLNRRLRSGDLDKHDEAVVKALIKDITKALNGQ